MKLRPIADFKADFPDDAVWDEDDEPIILGGRAVAETVAGYLKGFGCELSEPEHTPPYGWRFEAHGREARVWIQITDLTDNIVLHTEDKRPFFKRLFAPVNAEHMKLLTKLHGKLADDPRFSDIKWWDRYDSRGVAAEIPVNADEL
ncbi:MAG: hypothetical protein KKE02_02335 [Alphaproteobacteria bacterium]|nr:hypothetical protein [Alphaproteobacteria bacterium]MBU1513485.1 hypothetical protein [Alphaproteobacteria bacterium]MBU2096477.1 hypothetical protein [Alphaproteobacteria bacterium]MBU2149831.1 hypothetical protein [Alphaproteobacteria bacterium]MBU2305194.1 hypothetical protein [Alphaproteobacteria bacterium]